ncbi:hypothetical protein K445DRAFT_363809 [Daldinia sp. EC12]|nr:hypothetical protein K445DRAFT_363809 [Daldinia sp. EC12]
MAFNPPMPPLLPFNNGNAPFAHPHPHRNEAVVCVVCGGICRPTVQCAISHRLRGRNWLHPCLVKAEPGFVQWCKDTSTAKSTRTPNDDLIKLFQVVRFRGGSQGFGVEGEGFVGVNTNDWEMYLPIHKACFELTKIFCQFQSRFDIDFRKFSKRDDEDGIPSKLGHFYEVWMKRALMTKPGNRGFLKPPIDEPNGYLDIFFTSDLEEYKTAVDDGNPMIPIQEADPSGNNARTTEIVLKHLVLLPKDDRTPSKELQSLQYLMDVRLPLELKTMILGKLEPFQRLPREHLACTRVLPPSWWKRGLFNGDLFPWLFDIDESELDKWVQKLKAKNPDEIINVEEDLDWEQLCRRLGQRQVFGRNGILHGENYLENRYRIWILLDKARLAHTISRYSHGIRS